MQKTTLHERCRASKQVDIHSFFKRAACKFPGTESFIDVDPKSSITTSSDCVQATLSDTENPDAMSTH